MIDKMPNKERAQRIVELGSRPSSARPSTIALYEIEAKYAAMPIAKAYLASLEMIEKLIKQARVSGKREGSNRLFGMDDFTAAIEEAETFIKEEESQNPLS